MYNLSLSCNNSNKDYFVNIKIDGIDQTPRRRLTYFNYLRKDINQTFNANFTLAGSLIGQSPIKIEEQILFINSTGKPHFSIYHAESGYEANNVPDDFNEALIFETLDISNKNQMEICFWDNETQRMIMCLNEGYLQRATTIRRSLQIVGNITDKENDLNFTLCENNKYVDCSTDITGADLLVHDDIEAIGSIYSQENMTANYFIGNLSGGITANQNINISPYNLTIGDKIIFRLGEIIDNLIDNWLTITGNLNITGNITVENILINNNLNVDGIMTGTMSLKYTEVNISGGIINYTSFYMGVLGEGGLNDDLDTIIGGNIGDVVNIVAVDSSSDIRLKDGTGNLNLNGVDCDLKSVGNKAELRKSNNNWTLVMCT